jgi:hypothetical protein
MMETALRRIDSVHDQMNGVITYELEGGKRVRMAAKAVHTYGAAAILHDMGLAPDPAKLPRRPIYWGRPGLRHGAGQFRPDLRAEQDPPV